MSPHDPDHNTKVDAPTEHDCRRLQLLANWYQRQACSFVGQDPLSPRERLSADRRRKAHLADAQLFLDIRAAEKKARKEEKVRAGLRVIDGRRS